MALLRKRKQPAGRRRPAASGSSEPKTFSYSRTGTTSSSQAERASNAAAKKPATTLRHFWLQRFGLIVLVAVAAVCLVNVLSLSSHAKILPLKTTDTTTFLRDPAIYQAAADKLLAGSIWNRNKITINTRNFNREMARQFPELSSVSLALPLLAHRPVVYLQPAQPALVLAADNGSFVIDERGKALLPADGSPAQAKLPQVVDQSGLNAELHKQVLSSASVSFIQTIVAQLAVKHVSVSSLVLPAGSSEVDARIAGQTYFVKFNLHEDNPRQQAGTYLATVANLRRKNTMPAKYIDVRVPGRAYYQ